LRLHCLNRLTRFIKVYKNKNKKEKNINVLHKILCKDSDALYVEQRVLSTSVKWKNISLILNLTHQDIQWLQDILISTIPLIKIMLKFLTLNIIFIEG